MGLAHRGTQGLLALPSLRSPQPFGWALGWGGQGQASFSMALAKRMCVGRALSGKRVTRGALSPVAPQLRPGSDGRGPRAL